MRVHSAYLFLLVSISLWGCGATVVPDEGNTTSESSGGDPNSFVLDFTSSERGVMYIGGNENVAFVFDSSLPVRRYSMSVTGAIQVKPGLMLTFDFGHCELGGSVIEKAETLEAGEAVNVEFVDIELVNSGDHPKPLPRLCFGYRVPNEGWRWQASEAERITPTPVGLANELSVRFVLQKGPIDGIKIMSEATYGVKTITYTVEP
jgi:hypothetical protein